MSASVNDKFRIASGSTKPVVTSLSLPKSAGSTTAELTQATGWNTTTGLDYVMYRRQLNVATGQYEEQPGTRIEGIAELSGTTLSNMTITAGTEPVSGYAADGNTVILCSPTAQWADDLVGGILNFANQDATLKTSAVQAALGIGNATNTGFTPFGATMTYTGNNGNKEYTANIAADVTSFLPLGAKIAVTRGTAPPTQCMIFTASSSQYASKTSPTGITSTSALTVDEWVYVTSYPSADVGITSRHDGTNGFILGMTAAGQLKFFNGSVSSQTAYQSLPLKRWVHIAASFSAGTMVLYTNGAVVPSFLTGSGSTITQAGNLQLGAYNSTHFFDGYISEARIWSTVKTQSEIQANMNISLSGSETGLVALFQGNGNFNDKTSNANNLTPSGGAIATQTANPMNTVEYFKVTKIGAYSGGVTPVTLFGGTDCNLPNMTLTGAQYSTIDKPFGFPNSKLKWRTEAIWRTSLTAGLAANQIVNLGSAIINIPTGEFDVVAIGGMEMNRGAGSTGLAKVSLSTSATTIDPDYAAASFHVSNVASIDQLVPFTIEKPVSNTSLTPLYVTATDDSSGSAISIRGDHSTFRIFGQLAY